VISVKVVIRPFSRAIRPFSRPIDSQVYEQNIYWNGLSSSSFTVRKLPAYKPSQEGRNYKTLGVDFDTLADSAFKRRHDAESRGQIQIVILRFYQRLKLALCMNFVCSPIKK